MEVNQIQALILRAEEPKEYVRLEKYTSTSFFFLQAIELYSNKIKSHKECDYKLLRGLQKNIWYILTDKFFLCLILSYLEHALLQTGTGTWDVIYPRINRGRLIYNSYIVSLAAKKW